MRTRRSRSGLTLIELVVATALAAMMMAAMVGVLRGVSRQTQLAKNLRHEQWPNRFEELLRRDLLSAELLHASDGFVWLTGEFASYDEAETAERRTVGFGCVPFGKKAALVRVDDSSTGFVAVGPRRIVLERLDASGHPQPLPPRPGPVPRCVRLWLWEAPDASPTFTTDIVLY